jgi:quinol---cytochrome c reductase iron-sulfur subunit, bacillus type
VLETTELPQGRRRFLTGTIYAIASVIGGALCAPAVAYLTGRRKSSDTSPWVDAGELKQIAVGTPREISFRRNETDGWKIHSAKETAWILRKPGGDLVAFSPWCTHLGCAYRWDAGRAQFSCPCHGSWFSKNGDVISGPAPRPLDRYDVRVTGKRIWLGSLHKVQDT